MVGRSCISCTSEEEVVKREELHKEEIEVTQQLTVSIYSINIIQEQGTVNKGRIQIPHIDISLQHLCHDDS